VLSLPPSTLVFLAAEPVDGRKGIDGLSAIVQSQFLRDPLSGHLFVFFSRQRDRARILYWDRNGYVLICKRLEKGRFKPAPTTGSHGRIEAAELMLVLEGISLVDASRRARWTPSVVARK
jgi:transposase